MNTTSEDAYFAWLWQIVDKFDRWTASRLPMVQGMIRDSVGNETQYEAVSRSLERIKKVKLLNRGMQHGPCKKKKDEKKRNERLMKLQADLTTVLEFPIWPTRFR